MLAATEVSIELVRYDTSFINVAVTLRKRPSSSNVRLEDDLAAAHTTVAI
jgi:hypothetical protein